MTNNLKFGNPILYRTPFWVTLKSDTEVKIKLIPLSHKEVKELEYYSNSDDSNYNTPQDILASHTVDTHNLFEFPSFTAIYEQLPKTDIDYLFNKLLEMSTLSQSQKTEIYNMLMVIMYPKFQDESWDCEVCKHKKLQAYRACGFIPEEERLQFSIRVKDKQYTQCPFSTLNAFVANLAADAYRTIELGLLFEQGGVGNQTTWAITAAGIYKRLINEIEKEKIEARRKKG